MVLRQYFRKKASSGTAFQQHDRVYALLINYVEINASFVYSLKLNSRVEHS